MRPARLVTVLLGAGLLAPAAASATAPGANGRLAVTENACQAIFEEHVVAYTATGRRLGALTPQCDTYQSPGGDPLARSTSWPDWSPDGSRLLYASGGGGGLPARYETVDAAGADRRVVSPPIRSADSRSAAPSFAPDGRRFAYVDDRRIMVAPGDGRPATALRTLAGALQVEWAPKGGRLAVLRAGTRAQNGLWLLSARTGKVVRRLTKVTPRSADWSPDGRRLVVGTSIERSELDGAVTGGNLALVRADGRGAPRRIVRTRKVGAIAPAWSPDGRSIAWVQVRYTAGDVGFRAFTSLWRRPATTRGKARKVTTLFGPAVEEGFHVLPKLAWQPIPRR